MSETAFPARSLPDPAYHEELYRDVPTKRLMAWGIDVVLISAIVVVLTMFSLFSALFFLPLLYGIVSFLYRWGALSARSATPGMRMMAVELRTASGQPLDLVLDWAAIRYPEFAHKAATLYLKGNEPVRSLQLNRRIPDQQEKFRQRLGIDIYTEDYESLVAKLPALKRYGLMEDDHIKYAVGYAYFVNGDYTNAKRYLQSITDTQLFRKASHIFQQIETCQNELFTCY